MRGLALAGIVLIVIGIAALVVPAITITETDTVAEVGPLQLEAEEEHTFPIPAIAGVLAILAGLGLVFASRRPA